METILKKNKNNAQQSYGFFTILKNIIFAIFKVIYFIIEFYVVFFGILSLFINSLFITGVCKPSKFFGDIKTKLEERGS